jgi:hypothetical protein
MQRLLPFPLVLVSGSSALSGPPAEPEMNVSVWRDENPDEGKKH